MSNDKSIVRNGRRAIVLIVLIIVIAAGLIYSVERRQDASREDGRPAVAASGSQNDPYIGNPQAPVTIEVWFDYQCPFCKRLEENTLPALIKDYVQSGKAKIIFKDFAFVGPDSRTASLIARAVWDAAPDKFYAYHQAVFARQDSENSGWGSQEDLLSLVQTIPGLDSGLVKSLLDAKNNTYQSAIDSDLDTAKKLGLRSAPTIIIGKQILVGAQPYSSLSQLIDLELVKK